MSGIICYFIGGPLDLTKSVMQRAEPQLFALGTPALTLNEVNNKQNADYAMALLTERHVYERTGFPFRSDKGGPVVVYQYRGLVDARRRPDFLTR